MHILHFFPNEKFTVDYIDRIRQLFDFQEHTFYIYNNENSIINDNELNYNNVFFGEISNDTKQIRELVSTADRIILHGLFLRNDKIFSLWKNIKTHKKIIWVIWGGDLYDTYRRNHISINPKRIIAEHIRKKIILKLYGIVATEDFSVAKKLYKTNAIQFPATYSYSFVEKKPLQKKDSIVNIMVGHSATKTCRHIEVFEKLLPYRGKIHIFCPLSYPKNQRYINMIVTKGKELFGDDFSALTDFMQYPDYVEFLNQIDIGIFNNDRQQGNGNIVNLLFLGKKLYMSPENNLMKMYSDLGAVIYEIKDVGSHDFLTLLSDEIIQKNHKVILDRYSDESFYKDWTQVFTG